MAKECDGRPQFQMSDEELTEKLKMSLAAIGLSVRARNTLEDKGIFKVKDLLNRKTLDGITNLGDKTKEEIFACLSIIGFVRRRK